MEFLGKDKEKIKLSLIDNQEANLLNVSNSDELTILWFLEDDNQLKIDGQLYHFNKNQVVSFTGLHKIEATAINKVNFLRFNRSFFCVIEHDSEIGCKGILFFGASKVPVMNITALELDVFETVWKMFTIEMKAIDKLQMEMLQMMLKRYLILCTRLYKQQHHLLAIEASSMDIIREFNYLVENYFKTKHTVAEYADLLNKSPKTLSNLFAKLGSKSPLQFIQERRILEAKRLLRYSDKSIKEIAYELGYEDIQTFSRFFKNNEGLSPSEFKEKPLSGIIATL